jgi:hypothetical protein
MKHEDLIRAALDGAVIQRVYYTGEVATFGGLRQAIYGMLDYPAYQYRIKPADTVWYRAIYSDHNALLSMWASIALCCAANYKKKTHIGIERITISDGKLVSVEVVPEEEWRKPVADAGGWIKWEGGECPVPANTCVRYRMRSGFERLGEAGDLSWDNDGDSVDIVAYKVVET